jgi:membrane-bound lytic murein transglycosylase A
VCPAPTPQAAPATESAPITEPAAPVSPLQRANWLDLPGWDDDDLTQAWPALRVSCRALEKQVRWQAVCHGAKTLGDNPGHKAIRQFLETRLVPWAIRNPDGSSNGLITGYYEPLIKGSRTRSALYQWPIHGVPADMLTIDFGDLYPDMRNLRLRGRIVGNKVVPYWTRAELDVMQDRVPAPALLWAADPIDLFFLQVQGSGRVELPDGSTIRIGYADQNGHPYQSIGRWLVAQGELPLEKASMERIKNWARTNPHRLSELLHSNPSYVFFREMPASSTGPTGALGVPLTPGRSLAIDPRIIPLGAPVFLATTAPNSERPLRRLMLAQDTGGAIKGAVRGDFFWGFGPDAGAQAGKMRQQGALWVLLPPDDSKP